MPENMLGAEKNITEARMLEFGDGKGEYASKESFGNKGSILVGMSSLDIPVPPGFVLNISVCEVLLQKFKASSR
jgi:phosphoenolpyruvate synthase/pyruvate phosphate dikinase